MRLNRIKSEKLGLEEPVSGERIPLAGSWKARAELDLGVLTPASAPVGINTAGVLFDSMVRPLLPAAVTGVIWYQGESNATYTFEAARYLSQFIAMVRDWRYHFEQGNIPFLQVQLAGYGCRADYQEGSAWALLRDHQRRACEVLPEVYLTPVVDLGEEKDIHPQDKKSAGTRLAQTALYHVYGQAEALPGGPLFAGLRQIGHGLEICFDYGEGMKFTGTPTGFYLAGTNGKFFPATELKITGSRLFIAAPEVPQPVAVRYAWSDFPTGNLCGRTGLPAVPFRSDNWSIQP